MELHKALSQSRSGAAKATKDGKTFYCHSHVVHDIALVYAQQMAGRPINQQNLGYSVSVQEKDERPSHHERLDEMWEVEMSIKVNFKVVGLEWEPFEIEVV